jgi:hypothetical protein
MTKAHQLFVVTGTTWLYTRYPAFDATLEKRGNIHENISSLLHQDCQGVKVGTCCTMFKNFTIFALRSFRVHLPIPM